MDEDRAISAKDIVENPELIPTLLNEYILLSDSSAANTFVNFVKAINLFAEYGWEIGSMTSAPPNIFVLCRNPYHKSKRES